MLCICEFVVCAGNSLERAISVSFYLYTAHSYLHTYISVSSFSYILMLVTILFAICFDCFGAQLTNKQINTLFGRGTQCGDPKGQAHSFSQEKIWVFWQHVVVSLHALL